DPAPAFALVNVARDYLVEPGPVGPAGVVAQEDHYLAELLVVELAVLVRRGDLDGQHVVAAGAGEESDQQQPPVTVTEAGPRPDVGEEVVGGDGEEVACAVGHVEPIDLLHLLQPATTLLREILELA